MRWIPSEKISLKDSTFRPVPSGGARQPFETYILEERILEERIDTLSPGLSRYLPTRHAWLAQGCRANAGEEIKRSCYGQPSMDRLIGVDGANEFTVYIAAAGPRL